MRKPIISALAVCLLQFFIFKTFAQQLKTDSIATNAPESYAVNFFNKALGEQLPIYNGAEYTEYEAYIKNSAFYNDAKNFAPGMVTFNGFIYTNVPLKYDLYKDMLVALLYNKGSEYVLASYRVNNFGLFGHQFKYVAADTVNNLPAAGFYEQLYQGKRVQALIRHNKVLQGTTGTNSYETYFAPAKKRFFILKGTNIYQVDSEGSLLAVFKDRKKDLQQYIKANNLKYKKQPEQTLLMVTSYYDHLDI